ncbi:olfactory receptor 12D1-like [Discoglossus pictus]
MVNQTLVNEFILMGLTDKHWLQLVLFAFFLPFYLMNILANFIIMVLVSTVRTLHSPMYYLLANLSFLDISFSSVMVPKMLIGFFVENVISLRECFVQMHFHHFFGSTECVLLSTMAYDRYAAICHPLHYNVIMNKKVCYQLVFCSWLTGFMYSLTISVMSSLLPYCKFNKVRHFFCDVKPVIKLACANIDINEFVLAVYSGFISIGTFCLTIISYCYIITHLVKIKSSEGRRKAFSTCSSHLIVVAMFYGTAMCTYLGPVSEDSIEKDRTAAILFTIFTPVLNPVIYTLKNNEVKKALRKLFERALL